MKQLESGSLNNRKTIYGDAQVLVLAGHGYGYPKNLRRMMQLATVFEDHGIVATLLRQLSWSHFTLLIPLKDELQRNFYVEIRSFL